VAINIVITSAGLNKINESSPEGPLINIKYFVPVYDYRLDKDVCTGVAVNTSAYSSLSGEIFSRTPNCPPNSCEMIWNLPGYFNVDDSFIVSQNNRTITDSVGIGINTFFNGTTNLPLSDYNILSASGQPPMTPPTSADTSWGNQGVSHDGLVSSNFYANNNSLDESLFWKVNQFYPVIDDMGKTRGRFKIHLNSSNGNFKFNRIALYAVAVSSNGNEIGDPVYFADAFVSNYPIVISDVSEIGFDDFVCDIDLEFQTSAGDFSNIVYQPSSEYWDRTVNGLYTDTAVGVGALAGGNDLLAALHLRPLDGSISLNNLTSADTLRLDTSGSLGNDNFQTMNVGSDGTLYISQNASGASTAYLQVGNDGITILSGGLNTNVIGNNGGVDGNGEIILNSTIVPDSAMRSLGTSDKPFQNIYNSSLNVDYITSASGGEITLETTIVPGSNEIDLGSNLSQFNDIYLSGDILPKNGVSNLGTFPGPSFASVHAVTGDFNILTTESPFISIAKSLVPVSDNSFDLGTTSKHYGNLYVNYIHGSTDGFLKISDTLIPDQGLMNDLDIGQSTGKTFKNLYLDNGGVNIWNGSYYGEDAVINGTLSANGNTTLNNLSATSVSATGHYFENGNTNYIGQWVNLSSGVTLTNGFSFTGGFLRATKIGKTVIMYGKIICPGSPSGSFLTISLSANSLFTSLYAPSSIFYQAQSWLPFYLYNGNGSGPATFTLSHKIYWGTTSYLVINYPTGISNGDFLNFTLTYETD